MDVGQSTIASVPGWAVENRKRFLSIPPITGTNKLDARSITRQEAPLLRQGEHVEAAVSMGVITRGGRSGIPPPSQRPPAEYYRDPVNHPDVLSTILDTARVTARYDPNAGTAQEQHDGFRRFVAEVDKYSGYVRLSAAASQVLNNEEHDCSRLLNAVMTFIESSLDVDAGFREALQATIIAAADYTTSQNSGAKQTSYEMIALPAITGDPYRNPACSLVLSVVEMDRSTTPGKNGGTALSESFVLTSYTYQLVSSVVIASADILAGATITSTEELVSTMNTRK